MFGLAGWAMPGFTGSSLRAQATQTPQDDCYREPAGNTLSLINWRAQGMPARAAPAISRAEGEEGAPEHAGSVEAPGIPCVMA
jgi:hypothetical protein